MSDTIRNSITSYGIAQAAAQLLGTGAGDPALLAKLKASGLSAKDISAQLASMGFSAAVNVEDTFAAILESKVRNWQSGVQLP
jgi:hypothetical protein